MPKQKYNLKNCYFCKRCKNCNNCPNCKKYILNGGKLIGQGSYGCVFRPMIPCKGSNKRIPGKVSKFLNKDEANDEIKENTILDKIDKENIFHFKTPKKCDFNMKYKNEPGINKCVPFMNENKDFKRMKLLQMSDGGMELGKFLENVELKNKEQEYKLLLGMEPLFIGLKVMYENEFSHYDIKTLNTVIDPKTYQMKYIDFGISNYNKNHWKTVGKSSRLYFARPIEIPILYYYYNNIQDIDEIEEGLLSEYWESYSSFIDELYVRDDDSAYFPKNCRSFLKTFLTKATNNLKQVVKEVISKTDVFSVGIMCLYIFKKITKQKFDIGKRNKKLNEINSAFYTLIKNMLQPSSFLRFSGIDAHLFYETEIKTLINKEMNKCPPNKILNPKTKKCVSRTGKIGRKLVQGSKSKSSAEKKKPPTKICPPNKIINPKTKRCVSRIGKIGREIIGKIKPKPGSLKDVTICPPNKILNPKTKRCVLRSGKIGRELVKKEKPVKTPSLMSMPNCKGKKESDCKTDTNCRYVKGKKRQYCRKK